MRWLKIIGYSLFVLLVLITTFSIVMSSFYEKEIKKYIIEAINEQVNVPINVKDLDFSVLKKFPYASVEFKEVEIASTNHKSPLLKVKSVYFQFNIIDLLNKKYVLKKISIENGSTFIFIDKLGKNNFHFWKTSPDSTMQPIAFELSDVQFKNMDVNYLNNYKQQDMGVVVNKMSFSGNFNENSYHLKTKIALYVNQLNSENEAFLKNKNIAIEGKIEVNKPQKSYKIKAGELRLEELIFKLEGEVIDNNEELNLQLSSKGTEVDFATLFSLLPAQIQASLAAYDANGVFNYQAQVSGLFSATKTPHVEADFQVKSGKLKEQKSGYELSNIHFSGVYNNGANNNAVTTQLTISNFNADFGAGKIAGNYEITNFKNPYIQFTSEANIDIAMAKEFFKLDSLETATGELILNVTYKGYISNLQKIKASELQQLNAQGNAQLINTHLKWQSKPYQLINANAYFEFNNNLIKIDSLTTTVNRSPVYISGVFKNLLAYLFVENEKLEVTASFTSPKFMLEDFLLQSSSSSQSEQEVSLPDNITFTFTTQIDTFLFRRFKAQNFRGVIQLEDNLLSATDVSFNSMGGHIKGSIALDNENPNELLITSNAKMFDIDITQLFYQFENFGQTALDAENLKGKAAIAVDFASVWDKHLNVNKDKIYTSSTIIIKNGKLIDYEPVMALSKFIEIDELKRIKFNQLKTDISINQQEIKIAKTEISSSAINLTLSGNHHFNNDIDYRVKVDLNNILWDKAKKRKKQNEEFGYVEDDGLGKGTVFLKIMGNVANYKVSYDTDGFKSNLKENIQEEKRTLKSILNKEFGWFKKDTTIAKEEPKKKDGLKIKWEEAEEGNTTPSDDKKKKESEKKKEKTGLRKFLDKIANPNEEELEDSEAF